MSSSPSTNTAGMAMKTTRPAYGFSNSPASDGDHQRDEHHRGRGGDQRAGDRERMAGERFAALTRCPLLQALHVGDERVESAAGSLPYFAGIGGFLVDLAFAATSFGSRIHCLMSSALSFAPTPSSGFVFLPLPAMEWQVEHFCAA